MNHRERAAGATALFIVFGIVGIVTEMHLGESPAWLLVAFYMLLVVNTYFSIRHFSQIIPVEHFLQQIVDWILVLFYATLAATLWNEKLFIIALSMLFAVATLKYALALPGVARPALLYRKIKMDVLGTLMALLALVGVLMGYGTATALTLVVIFAIANIYMLLAKPLYDFP